jgi:hypothetical protein
MISTIEHPSLEFQSLPFVSIFFVQHVIILYIYIFVAHLQIGQGPVQAVLSGGFRPFVSHLYTWWLCSQNSLEALSVFPSTSLNALREISQQWPERAFIFLLHVALGRCNWRQNCFVNLPLFKNTSKNPEGRWCSGIHLKCISSFWLHIYRGGANI